MKIKCGQGALRLLQKASSLKSDILQITASHIVIQAVGVICFDWQVKYHLYFQGGISIIILVTGE